MKSKKRQPKAKKIKNIGIINIQFFKKTNLFIFASLFAIFGVIVLLRVYASTTYLLEAENAAKLNNCVTDISDQEASGKQAIQFNCSQVSGFIHPGVVYTQADINNWSTDSDQYKKLAATGAGSLTTTSSRYEPVKFGAIINSGGESGGNYKDSTNELNAGMKDQSMFAKIQAVLYAADGNNARREKTISYLKELGSVTKIEWDKGEQWRLVAGWSCTNYAQAAELVDYQDEEFQRFLRDVCFPILDWPGAGNWQASFADSKLAIAAYLGDPVLWTDAKAYFYERISQAFYVAKYDGTKVNPIHYEDTVVTNNPDGTRSVTTSAGSHETARPHVGRTTGTWGKAWVSTGGQVNDDFTLNYAFSPIVDGINTERIRDLGHVSMGLGAWAHGARTILAQGEKLEQHAYDRLLHGYDHHAGRVLHHTETGEFLEPVPVNGDGGGSRFYGFEHAKALFGDRTPQTVLSMLKRPEVIDRSPSGFNHLGAEQFADGLSVPINEQETKATIGIIEGTIHAPVSNTYTLWIRMRAADSTNNAVKSEIGATTYVVGNNANIPSSGWTWVNYRDGDVNKINSVQLSQGNHTIRLTGIEPGVMVDRILILHSTCVPISDGSNCTNIPPTVSLTSPSSGLSFIEPASIQLQASASDSDGTITKVEFFRDGQKIGEDTSSPYEYSLNDVADGSYTLSAKAYDNQGSSAVSSLVSVSVTPGPVAEPDPEPDPVPTPDPTPEPGPLPTPTGFRVDGKSQSEIGLIWDASTDPRVDRYMLRYTRANSPTVQDFSTWTYPGLIRGTSYRVTGLDTGTEYLFQLRTRDTKGTQDSSDDLLSHYTRIISGSTSGKPWWKFWNR